MLSLWLAISFKFSRLAAKIAINSFWCFLILNYGKTIGVARILDWEGRAKPQMTGNDVIKIFWKKNLLWDKLL